MLRDSTYYDPQALAPYSGRVTSTFLQDPETVQLEGEMLEGIWHGELRVYHPDGRIRYEGRLERGAQCGAWTENTDPRPPEGLYQEFRALVETLAVYPPCGGGPDAR